MVFILQYWRYIVTAGVTLAAAYFLHSLDVNYLEIKHQNELQTQKEQFVQSCKDQKKITEDETNVLLKNTANLNAKLDAYRVRINKLSVPATNAPIGDDGATSFSGYVGQRRFDAWLEYFADAERYRIKLISCQSFIRKVWSQYQ